MSTVVLEDGFTGDVRLSGDAALRVIGDESRVVDGLVLGPYIVRIISETKHMGPGPHPSGTPQAVHGSGARKVLDSLDAFKGMHAIEEVVDLGPSTRGLMDFIELQERREDVGGVRAARMLLRTAGALQRGELAEADSLTVAQQIEVGGRLAAEAAEIIRKYPDEPVALSESSIKSASMRVLKHLMGYYESSPSFPVVDDTPFADPDEPLVVRDRSMDPAALKADVARQIAEGLNESEHDTLIDQYGVRPDAAAIDYGYEPREHAGAAALVANWAQSSNDENLQGLVLQDAAEAEFSLDGAAQWHTEGGYGEEYVTDIEALEEGQRTVLRQMYERTQVMFAEEGITHVKLYRGQGVPKGWDQKMRPLSSWSVSESSAQSFSEREGVFDLDAGPDDEIARSYRAVIGRGEFSGGVVFTATIPVDRILCTPKTGLGCLNEAEMVVLGGPLEDMVEPLREVKHGGPGPHRGTGTPQAVHAGGGVGYRRAMEHLSGLALRSDVWRTKNIAERLHEKMTRGIPDHEQTYGTLDLDWMGSYAPIKASTDAETTTRRARKYLRDLPTYEEGEHAHEQGIVVLADGSILGNHIQIGRARSIPVDLDELQGHDIAVSLHNHPRENSLSPGDVMVGIHTGADRVEAVTRKGEFVLEIDHDVLDDDFPRKADSVAQALNRFARDAFADGDLTEEQARYGTGIAMIRTLLDVRPDAFSYTEQGGAQQAESEVWPSGVLNEFLAAVHREGPLT